ncbi:predicted AlkP superfamily pyrophosphatase or phosphodiesterase [Bacillus oleivorans]|uniref:Predicted AlkP superfamily pyrophosphatase or phosphodiesterase n=1 Tax=Bacillus oleivorans TaxID=1448271 RepID=A0A285CP79_9BACI|nr:alkaline phosphatase family protein [Bacillus oleivorans]SNX68783.1 predicted AlkP superfamily pyrophosphatase or phosphodiesterase [Bacillus oleivorans]
MIQNKPIIMLMIDSLMNPPLQEALKNGRAKALQFFAENGQYIPDIVSPFPTMSVNVDSTLLTGVYSDQHKVPGLVWYHKNENRIVNYGSHVRELYRLGTKQSVEDIFYRLNNRHLAKEQKTIHEILKDSGKPTASINTLIYRGSEPTQIKVPFLLSLVTGLKRRFTVTAPAYLSYGAMSKQNPQNPAFIWQKYGFNNKFALNELKYLINENELPDFTLVYLSDSDKRFHKNGPMDVAAIEKTDQQLQSLLNTFPSWEKAIEDYIWVILGDNGQAWVDSKKSNALIDLRSLLNSYKIPKLKATISAEDEIVLGVNERMSFIYTLHPNQIPLNEIAEILQKDSRIDVIAWNEECKINVISGIREGKLTYQPDGNLADPYGQMWSIEGESGILDLSIEGNRINEGDYPDALQRLYASFHSHEGDYLVVSAKPGYEFIGEGSPTHVGGASHGGLHKQDSQVAMIVTGTNKLPKYNRIKDIKDWVLDLLT